MGKSFAFAIVKGLRAFGQIARKAQTFDTYEKAVLSVLLTTFYFSLVVVYNVLLYNRLYGTAIVLL